MLKIAALRMVILVTLPAVYLSPALAADKRTGIDVNDNAIVNFYINNVFIHKILLKVPH